MVTVNTYLGTHYTVKKYECDVIVVIFNVTEENNNIANYPDNVRNTKS